MIIKQIQVNSAGFVLLREEVPIVWALILHKFHKSNLFSFFVRRFVCFSLDLLDLVKFQAEFSWGEFRSSMVDRRNL